MKAIVSGFETLLTIIKTLFGMIENLFKGLGYMFLYVGTVWTKLAIIIRQMPGWVSGFMLATLLFSILYLIVGRNGGKSD